MFQKDDFESPEKPENEQVEQEVQAGQEESVGDTQEEDVCHDGNLVIEG